jgi:chromatin structure-remodeling complex subunit RSC9
MLVRADPLLVEAIPRKTIICLLDLLFVEDEELIGATLDFLYQYTAHGSNVSRLLNSNMTVPRIFGTHLVRLLTWGMPDPQMDYIRLPRRTKKKAPENPPVISEAILAELLDLQEPDRATHWIRTAYEDDADGEVTQISLWKAYESQFEQHARTHGRRLLPAVDFIKNVTSAFKTSAAMVVNLPDGSKRFIIKGIRPREVAVAPSVLRAQEEAEANPQPDNAQLADPTPFGLTAVLVLQNLGRTPEGRRLLQPSMPDLIAASIKNSAIAQYVEDLLDLLGDASRPAGENIS